MEGTHCVKRLLCTFGIHSWLHGCYCIHCGRTRTVKNESEHMWGSDCEKCSGCGKTRSNAHTWQGCECSSCGAKRNGGHEWNVCKCAKCGVVRNYGHDWEAIAKGHNWEWCKCKTCGASRDEEHNWKGCKCTVCGKVRDVEHVWGDYYCTVCGKTPSDEQLRHNLVSIGRNDPEQLVARYSESPYGHWGRICKEVLVSLGSTVIEPLTQLLSQPDISDFELIIPLLNERGWVPKEDAHQVYHCVFRGNTKPRQCLGETMQRLGQRALTPLITCLKNRSKHESAFCFVHGTTVKTIIDALSQLGDPARKTIAGLLADQHAGVREAVVVILARIGGPEAIPVLVDALSDSEKEVRTAAIRAMVDFDNERCRSALLKKLESPDDTQDRYYVIDVLGTFGERRAVPRLCEILKKESSSYLVSRAIHALGRIGGPVAESALLEKLCENPSTFKTLRKDISEALATLKSASAVGTLSTLYNNYMVNEKSDLTEYDLLASVGNSIKIILFESPNAISIDALHTVMKMTSKVRHYRYNDDPGDDPSTHTIYKWAVTGFDVSELHKLGDRELERRNREDASRGTGLRKAEQSPPAYPDGRADAPSGSAEA